MSKTVGAEGFKLNKIEKKNPIVHEKEKSLEKIMKNVEKDSQKDKKKGRYLYPY